jgi:hypothetical protein
MASFKTYESSRIGSKRWHFEISVSTSQSIKKTSSSYDGQGNATSTEPASFPIIGALICAALVVILVALLQLPVTASACFPEDSYSQIGNFRGTGPSRSYITTVFTVLRHKSLSQLNQIYALQHQFFETHFKTVLTGTRTPTPRSSSQ